ncbi:MAG: hypothetical protein M1824_001363 [Vezdaea acicularis]|nr:MAG: hypothetical protein M1824_001363 [Vezdaea acicularis]
MSSLLGAAYESSDEDSPSNDSNPYLSTAATVVAAPDVSLEDPMHQQMILTKPTDTSLTYNVPYSDLSRLQQGPVNPFKSTEGNALKRKNVLTGYAEEAIVSDSTFVAQHHTYQSLGYTKDPSGAIVGNFTNAQKFDGKDVVQMRPSREDSEAIRRKRQRKGDASIVDGDGAYKGPWARYRDEDLALEEEALAAGEELASDEEYEDEPVVAPAPTSLIAKSAEKGPSETTEFHGSSLHDYQGRTYIHIPQDLDIDLRKETGSTKNYVPKKLIHTWAGHQKPVTALRFFPHAGHLLLSASADSTIKIWDVYHSRELLRSFCGHSKAITDAQYDPIDGRHFLSASYDRQIKLWDTETGICISRHSTGKIPHCLAINPGSPSEFLAGMSDKKIIQFDTRITDSKTPVQEYDHHLGAVNTLTFCDANRRFISTSDDKSLRAWEFNIPVPIKFIAEPYMYALTSASPHPSGKYVAFQSADNQIVVYASTDKFRQNRKKSFRGHNNAGFRIDVSISPDGNMLAGGDSGGFVCFWDWKTCKMWHKIQACDGGACTAVQWHPQESSKVATAGGSDGRIKFWD